MTCQSCGGEIPLVLGHSYICDKCLQQGPALVGHSADQTRGEEIPAIVSASAVVEKDEEDGICKCGEPVLDCLPVCATCAEEFDRLEGVSMASFAQEEAEAIVLF